MNNELDRTVKWSGLFSIDSLLMPGGTDANDRKKKS